MNKRAIRTFRKEVGAILSRVRMSQGLTQGDIADELNVTYQMYQHYELGNKAMDIVRLVEICAIMGIDPGQVINSALKNTNGRK